MKYFQSESNLTTMGLIMLSESSPPEPQPSYIGNNLDLTKDKISIVVANHYNWLDDESPKSQWHIIIQQTKKLTRGDQISPPFHLVKEYTQHTSRLTG